MDTLPYPLADPLRYPEPPGPPSLGWLVAALALLLLGGWLLYRRRRAARPRGVTPAAVPPGRAPTGIGRLIEEIRRRYCEASDYRGGAHALAQALRGFFGSALARPLDTLTGREIAAAARRRGRREVAGLFELLTDLQFRRRRPSADDFDALCTLAEETVSRRGSR